MAPTGPLVEPSPRPGGGGGRKMSTTAKGGTLGAPTTANVVSSHVQVLCRFRPLNAAEEEASVQGGPVEWFECAAPTNEVRIRNVGKDLDFQFDRVFDPSAKQADIFGAVSHVVSGTMDGFNGSLMAYGQTSSGKTHTMQGYGDQGIMPRALGSIFSAIDRARAAGKEGGEEQQLEYSVRLAYVEIYCEKIQDLLNTKRENLDIYENAVEGVAIKDVTTVPVSTMAEVNAVLKDGQRNRATSATKMNAGSSRSHALLQVLVTLFNHSTMTTRRAKLMLVDLAGSERVGKTGVTAGARMEEAKNINRSLTTLGIVIRALAEGSAYIPFRDSKLTRLLQESLGGNSKTALVICCAPELKHAPETVSTLRFGERARQIATKIHRNETLGVKELRVLLARANAEIDQLKSRLASLPPGSTMELTHGPSLSVSSTISSQAAFGSMTQQAATTLEHADEEPVLQPAVKEKVDIVRQITGLSMMVKNLQPLMPVDDVASPRPVVDLPPQDDPVSSIVISPTLMALSKQESMGGSSPMDDPRVEQELQEKEDIRMIMTQTLALTGRSVLFEEADDASDGGSIDTRMGAGGAPAGVKHHAFHRSGSGSSTGGSSIGTRSLVDRLHDSHLSLDQERAALSAEVERLERLLAETKQQWEESTAALAAKSGESDRLSALLEVSRQEAAAALQARTQEAEQLRLEGEKMQALLADVKAKSNAALAAKKDEITRLNGLLTAAKHDSAAALAAKAEEVGRVSALLDEAHESMAVLAAKVEEVSALLVVTQQESAEALAVKAEEIEALKAMLEKGKEGATVPAPSEKAEEVVRQKEELSRLGEQLAATKKQLASKEAEVQQLSEQIRGLVEQSKEQAAAARASKEEEAGRQKEEVVRLQTELTSKGTELASKEAEVQQLSERLQELLEKGTEQAAAALAFKDEEVARQKEEVVRLGEQLAATKKQLASKEAEVQQLSEQVRGLAEQTKEQAGAAHASKAEEEARQKEEVARLSEQLAATKTQLASKEAEVQQLSASLEEKAKSLSEARAVYAMSQEELAAIVLAKELAQKEESYRLSLQVTEAQQQSAESLAAKADEVKRLTDELVALREELRFTKQALEQRNDGNPSAMSAWLSYILQGCMPFLASPRESQPPSELPPSPAVPRPITP